MTAAFYDEVSTTAPAPKLTAVHTPKQTARRADCQAFDGDPLIGGATRLLCVPLRQLYAAMWRVGLLEVVA
jgi:hypothetical protein